MSKQSKKQSNKLLWFFHLSQEILSHIAVINIYVL